MIVTKVSNKKDDDDDDLMRHSHQKVVPCQCWPAWFQTASFQLPESSYRGSKFRWPIVSGSGFRSNTERGIKNILGVLERGIYVCISMFPQTKLDLQSCWITTVSQRALQASETCTSSLWDFWLPLLATERHGWAGGEHLPSGFQKTHPCMYYCRVKIFQDWKKTGSPSSNTGGHRTTWAIFSTSSGRGRDWAVKASFTGRNLVSPVFLLLMRTWKSASATTHFCHGRPLFCVFWGNWHLTFVQHNNINRLFVLAGLLFTNYYLFTFTFCSWMIDTSQLCFILIRAAVNYWSVSCCCKGHIFTKVQRGIYCLSSFHQLYIPIGNMRIKTLKHSSSANVKKLDVLLSGDFYNQ